MKKVAIYTGTYPDTTFLTLLARGLADSGVEVHIYGKLKRKTKEDYNIKFFTYSDKNKGYNFYFILKYVFLNLFFNYKKAIWYYRHIKSEEAYSIYKKSLIILPMIYHQPDIIHLQWIQSFKIFRELDEILNAKIVVSIRGSQLSISSFLYPDAWQTTVDATNKAVKIHSISDDLSLQLLKINPLVRDKIIKINPAIDLNLFYTAEASFNRARSNPLRIITVCRLSWKKGLAYGLEALKKIHDKGLNFEYIIIGEGKQREELTFLIRDLGLTNKVKLKGRLSQTEIRKALLNSDVFLLPSVQEGFSNAVVEAQAIGLPCLVSDAEGLEENIEHEKTGFIFKNRNVPELAALLEQFTKISNKDYIILKRNGVERSKARYDIKDQIIALKNLYENIDII
ncbi:glycosyltransferase family 4 protein [Aequorivita lipolytica]|uniref:Glycosyltransferase family 4 protein n=1 Tax=Aequorivita lipolytica TaxID=153267 RepID=A0A5C6YNB6_9FLAO|nr:glycosyltransferase family 4 protein [Aequorivita lipolytica]TXD68797.1 glycosyltransferase family 4 protein [Aequorivita lipolytica]SRX52047.1 2-deoxystreptamine glucosyltransferase [Aequorivita lipolytica]